MDIEKALRIARDERRREYAHKARQHNEIRRESVNRLHQRRFKLGARMRARLNDDRSDALRRGKSQPRRIRAIRNDGLDARRPLFLRAGAHQRLHIAAASGNEDDEISHAAHALFRGDARIPLLFSGVSHSRVGKGRCAEQRGCAKHLILSQWRLHVPLISSAFAQNATSASQSGLMSFLPLIAMFAVLYFIMIRPQMKRHKEHRTMLSALAKGDEVTTGGGLVGKVTQVGETYIRLEISEGVEILLQKSAITAILPKGSIKAI